MVHKNGFQKNIIKMLFVALLLCGCTAVVYAQQAPTVVYSPVSGSSIITGTPISATISGIGMSDPVPISVSVAGNSATNYGVPSFTLPFQLDGSTLAISGTNVDKVTISVTDPDSTAHSVTNYAVPGTLLTGYTAKVGPYTNHGVSIHATAQPTAITLSLTGNAHAAYPTSTLTLDTTGASVGSTITVSICGQSATYTVIANPTPIYNGGTGGDNAGATGVSAVQKGVVQQSTATSTVSVTGTGTVSSGTLSAGSIDDMTGATAGWSAASTSQPASGATITTTISMAPPTETLAAFQSAYQVQGQGINAVAYTMTVSKSGITSTGPATITMAVPLSWVESHGGLNSIGIARAADDGTVSTLATTYTVDTATGMVTFTAQSPNGLCVFAVVAVNAAATVAGNTTVTTTAPAEMTTATVALQNTAAPVVSATSAALPAAAATKTPLSLFAPLGALVFAVIGLALWRKQ
jgi:hypothetical protein